MNCACFTQFQALWVPRSNKLVSFSLPAAIQCDFNVQMNCPAFRCFGRFSPTRVYTSSPSSVTSAPSGAGGTTGQLAERVVVPSGWPSSATCQTTPCGTNAQPFSADIECRRNNDRRGEATMGCQSGHWIVCCKIYFWTTLPSCSLVLPFSQLPGSASGQFIG